MSKKSQKKLAKKTNDPKDVDEEDDDSWEDTDKNLKKKQQRKDDQMKKREQNLARKAETKKLLEEETKMLKSATSHKVSRAHIRSTVEKTEKEKVKVVESLPENVNRGDNEEVARCVEEAIAIFEDGGDDKHPEKRRKAAFLAFESRRIKELKSENPNLRLSQMKEVVFKEWQKSGENPMNQ